MDHGEVLFSGKAERYSTGSAATKALGGTVSQ